MFYYNSSIRHMTLLYYLQSIRAGINVSHKGNRIAMVQVLDDNYPVTNSIGFAYTIENLRQRTALGK